MPKERNTCYIYHSQMEEMQHNLNSMKVEIGVIHYDCECTFEVICKNPSMERVNE